MLARLTALAGPSGPAPSLSGVTDPVRHAQLAALGYVGHGPAPGADGLPSVAPDPKDKVAEYNRRTSRR